MSKLTRRNHGEAAIAGEDERRKHPAVPPGYWRRDVCVGRIDATPETQRVVGRDDQLKIREARVKGGDCPVTSVRNSMVLRTFSIQAPGYMR